MPWPELPPELEGRLRVAWRTKEDEHLSDDDLATTIEATGIAALAQAHGSRVIVANEPIARTDRADGLLTDTSNLALAVRAADCQLFLAYDPTHHIAGVLHAGWKGLIANIIPTFVQTMIDEWNTHPEDLHVFASPSLCTDCAEFTDPRTELPTIDPRFFHGRNVDLRAIADDQWRHAGMSPETFQRHPDCTRCDPRRYWTYRGGDREAVKKGMTNVLACVLSPLVKS